MQSWAGMQKWAGMQQRDGRGAPTAQPTGNVLASGSGAAPATEDSAGTAASRDPRAGRSQAAPSPTSGNDRGAAELFSGRSRHRAMTGFSGTIDPVRDLLPAVENERTRHIPALDEQGWVRPEGSEPESAQPARSEGTSSTPDAGRSSFEKTHPRLSTRAKRAYGRHAAVSAGTPAEGFPRSMSWNGRIGTVRKEVPPNQQLEFTGDSFVGRPAGLIEPSEDPATAPAFDQADGIVALWQGALGHVPATARGELPTETSAQTPLSTAPSTAPAAAPSTASPVPPESEPSLVSGTRPLPVPSEDECDVQDGLLAVDGSGGLLAPDSVDLASGELPTTSSRRHAVPDPVLSAALAAPARSPRSKSEVLPMRLPGDHQEQVDEVPDVSRGVSLTLDRGSEIPGVHAPLPGLEDLAALGQQVSAPLSRITRALDAEGDSVDTAVTRELPFSGLPGFTNSPLRSSVVLREVDDLAAAVPEQDRVLENPFRLDGAHAIGGMSLPLFDGGWSRFRAAGGPVFASAPAAEDRETTDRLPVVGAV